MDAGTSSCISKLFLCGVTGDSGSDTPVLLCRGLEEETLEGVTVDVTDDCLDTVGVAVEDLGWASARGDPCPVSGEFVLFTLSLGVLFGIERGLLVGVAGVDTLRLLRSGL